MNRSGAVVQNGQVAAYPEYRTLLGETIVSPRSRALCEKTTKIPETEIYISCRFTTVKKGSTSDNVMRSNGMRGVRTETSEIYGKNSSEDSSHADFSIDLTPGRF